MLAVFVGEELPCGGRRAWFVSGPDEGVRVELGDPLVDGYLEFVAARCRPNTVLATAYVKVSFSVVGKEPSRVSTADVFAFLSTQRAPRRGAGVVRLAVRSTAPPVRSSGSARPVTTPPWVRCRRGPCWSRSRICAGSGGLDDLVRGVVPLGGRPHPGTVGSSGLGSGSRSVSRPPSWSSAGCRSTAPPAPPWSWAAIPAPSSGASASSIRRTRPSCPTATPAPPTVESVHATGETTTVDDTQPARRGRRGWRPPAVAGPGGADHRRPGARHGARGAARETTLLSCASANPAAIATAMSRR